MSKLKKANRHSSKSVLETMPMPLPAIDTSNAETAASLGGAKSSPPLALMPSSVKTTAMESAIDLTESTPPRATKITPTSTRIENENTMAVSSSFMENEVVVMSSKEKSETTPTKLPPPSVNKPCATKHAVSSSTSANVNIPTSSTATNVSTTNIVKEPIQKKKKLSFHDKILYTMLSSCKPYTLKSLAQATDSTVEALRHAMLSFLDKQLVLSKEFPSKSSGREPKKLYWANPIRFSDGDSGDGGKKSSSGAVIKELSKLLATPNEIQEANLMRQQLQQQYRAIQEELNPLLAIPTMKQLDDEILAAEEMLQHLKNDIAAVKDRMGKPPPSLASSTSKQPKPSKPQDPTTLKRKINHMLGEYKTRKRKCMDFVEELSDAMEKKTKDVMGEKILCLDTDEMEWGVWEDGGTGKVFGTKPKSKPQKSGLLGRKNDVQDQPMTKIPAKYNDV
jgi:hypothetical protein